MAFHVVITTAQKEPAFGQTVQASMHDMQASKVNNRLVCCFWYLCYQRWRVPSTQYTSMGPV